jgi:nicotinate-nucleotide adenylyltransferase
MKLGVFGGTFDPIHLGHLHVASRIQSLFGLSQIHFVVAATPPHKRRVGLLPFSHRYAMVALATLGSISFVPSTVELEPPASPFSIHTLKKLVRNNGRDLLDVYFIAGGDSLLDVANWRDSLNLLTTYNFIFVARPGVATIEAKAVLPRKAAKRVREFRGLGSRQLRQRIRREEGSSENRIFIVDVDAPDISSSRIRSLVSSGKRIRHLVPVAVHEYIQKLRLYSA